MLSSEVDDTSAVEMFKIRSFIDMVKKHRLVLSLNSSFFKIILKKFSVLLASVSLQDGQWTRVAELPIL